MASPKNWERNNKMENQYNDLPYVWDHTKKNARVKVVEVNNAYVSGKYKVEGATALSEELYDNKQNARKDAVRWMEDHPMGEKTRSEGMSKYNRSRANRGR